MARYFNVNFKTADWIKWIKETVFEFVLLGEGLINCKILVFKSSVIRQKGETQTGDSRKESTSNFPKNEHFLPPDTHVRKKC